MIVQMRLKRMVLKKKLDELSVVGGPNFLWSLVV